MDFGRSLFSAAVACPGVVCLFCSGGKESLVRSPAIYSLGSELVGDFLIVFHSRRWVAAKLELIESDVDEF